MCSASAIILRSLLGFKIKVLSFYFLKIDKKCTYDNLYLICTTLITVLFDGTREGCIA